MLNTVIRVKYDVGGARVHDSMRPRGGKSGYERRVNVGKIHRLVRALPGLVLVWPSRFRSQPRLFFFPSAEWSC